MELVGKSASGTAQTKNHLTQSETYDANSFSRG